MNVNVKQRWHTQQRLLLVAIVILISFAAELTVSPQAFACSGAGCVNVATTGTGVPTNEQINYGAVGANVLQYVPHYLNSDIPGLMAKANIQAFRFPGGSNADYYHWETNTADTTVNTNYYKPVGSPLWPFTPYADGTMNFDAFMGQLAAMGGNHPSVDITVNYGTFANNIAAGANEAAAWVAYANKNNVGYPASVAKPNWAKASPTGNAYGVFYWEIGNEVYGDGTYVNAGHPNANWEYDTVPGPTNYANAVVQYSTAMKAVDSTALIGAVLTMPSNFPDGVTTTAFSKPWNDTVLTPSVCKAIDFVGVHWYPQQPGAENDATLLASTHSDTLNSNSLGIPTMMSKLRSQINTDCAASIAQHPIAIHVTESNSVNSNPGKQSVGLVNSMFLEDDILTFLENGAQSVDWWSLQNGFYQPSVDTPGQVSYATGNGPYFPANNNNVNGLYPIGTSIPYGDFGLLSNFTGNKTPNTPASITQLDNGAYQRDINTPVVVSEPPADTAFPSYYGLGLVGNEISANDIIATPDLGVPSTSSSSNLVAHILWKRLPIGNPHTSATVQIMLINEDPNATSTVGVNLASLASGSANTVVGVADQWTYGPGMSSVVRNVPATTISTASSVQVLVPPYTTVVLQVALT
jgi:hypothetical protein